MNEPLIIDAHEDLAWNILSFGRDYTLSAAETRQREQGSLAPVVNGDALLGWPDYQQGRVAIVFTTLFVTPERHRVSDWDQQCYASDEQAHDLYSRQLDVYDRLADTHPDMFRKIEKQSDLQAVLGPWQHDDSEQHPVGMVVLMEGAEGVREPAEVEDWYERGVRIIGPAWAGTRFCGGTREPGGLTKEGYALLDHMAELKITLDLSHMDEKAALQALDFYPGAIIASHANALALLKESHSNRHLTDQVLQGLLDRDGTVGIVPHNNFLLPGWKDTDGRAALTLEHVVHQIDYICQMAGNARHVGIGTDFDGGFGRSSVPAEIDTIADLRKLIPILNQKGYTQDDIAAILGNNWLAHLQNSLPEVV